MVFAAGTFLTGVVGNVWAIRGWPSIGTGLSFWNCPHAREGPNDRGACPDNSIEKLPVTLRGSTTAANEIARTIIFMIITWAEMIHTIENAVIPVNRI
jgi:hypothetical protein